jgi:hypothetical protein
VVLPCCTSYKIVVRDFIVVSGVCDVWMVHKIQSLAFMFDVVTGRTCISCFQFEINNLVHRHFTRSSTNVHINTVSSVDKRNFIYYSVLNWNACSVEMRTQSRYNFICSCKLLT